MKGSGKNDQENEDCIQVSVRVRPTLKNEMEEKIGWEWKDNTLTLRNCLPSTYSFDHLFPPESSNSDIFASVVQKVVYKSMQGFHGTVFTYGQTSSGKTFTMSGSQSQPGVIPLSIHYCFESIHKRFTDREFLIRVAYLEVYNEQVKDLLNTELSQIKIQHDVKLGTVLSGVKEQVVLNAQQVIALLKAGEAHRHVGNTDMNEKSSRAHTILKLTIESKARIDSADGPIRVSVLNLVDLAGSENAKMTGSTGERAREAKYINQSLLTLSLILQRLSTVKNASSHIQYLPFRDSKLTRLLQSSLSGNAQITIICTISPTLRCAEESLNTLKFAARAKSIRTRADVNEVMDDKTLLRMYRTEIHSLKTRLAVVETQGIELLLSDAIIERKSNEFSTDCSDINTQSSVSDIQSVTVKDEEWNIGENYDDDESTKILQMISEMERLILKADLTSLTHNTNKKTSGSAQTGISQASNTSKSDVARKSGLQRPTLTSHTKSSMRNAPCNQSTNQHGESDFHSIHATSSNDPNHRLAGTYLREEEMWQNIKSPSASSSLLDASVKDSWHTESNDSQNLQENHLSHEYIITEGENDVIPSKLKSSSVEAISAKDLPRRKLSFIPSNALSKSLLRVAEDALDKGASDLSAITYETYMPSKHISNDQLLIDIDGTDGETQRDNCLFGVPEMLSVLKHYIEKSSAVKRRPAQLERKRINEDCTLKNSTEQKISIEDYRLLLSELDKKDNMLSMLTTGLREVESSQQRWLADNETLYIELERALHDNQKLREQIASLQDSYPTKEIIYD